MPPSDEFLYVVTMAFCAILSCLSVPLLLLILIGVFL